MSATSIRYVVRRTAGAALAAVLVAAPTGCAIRPNSTDVAPAVTATPAGSATSAARVVVRFHDRAVAATLSDSVASRELAAMLPLSLELSDAWGQAKVGRLPHPLPVEGAAPTLKPTIGGIYYWPDTADVAVYYADLGQSVPPPGVIRLGVVDSDVDAIADAGREIAARVDRAPAAHP
jgi:hypothetical protein